MNDSPRNSTRKRKHQDDSHSSNEERIKKQSPEKDDGATVDIFAEADENEEKQIAEESELPKITKPFHIKKFREKLRESDFILGKILVYIEATVNIP